MPKATTLIELLRDRAQDSPQRNAFIWLNGGEIPANSLTFAQLDLRARAIAYHLQSQLQIGDRALLVYPYDAGLEFITAFLGCIYAGVIAVPSHSPRNRYALQDLKERLIGSNASVILSVASLQTRLRRDFQNIEELSAIAQSSNYWINPETIPDNDATNWQYPQLTGESLAFLQYTSGSTGTPKGVMITHAGLLFNQKMLSEAFGHTKASIGVGWLPLFHDMGLIGNLIQPLYLGSLCVLMSPIKFIQKPVRWLQAISKFRATTSGGPNFAYDLLCRHVSEKQRKSLDLSSWEVAFIGAEPVQAKTMSRFSELFAPYGFQRQAFYPCYGMAEATLFISGGNKSELPRLLAVDETAMEKNQVNIQLQTQELSDPGIVYPTNHGKNRSRLLVSCGSPGLETRIVIANPDSQTSCPSKQIGEIWVASRGLGNGYWENPQATKATFQAYLQDTGEGPFLRTGDLGFLYQGELFITGRRHDVMVFWGLNHYPHHIEQTVQNCHPAFHDQSSAAFAVKVNEENRLVIAQEVHRGYRYRIQISEVIEPIRWAIFEQHFIDVYSIVLLKPGMLPKTPSGKVQRSRCRSQFLEGTLPILDQWQASAQQGYDIPNLVQRYLNPLIHFKRYQAYIRTYLNQIIYRVLNRFQINKTTK